MAWASPSGLRRLQHGEHVRAVGRHAVTEAAVPESQVLRHFHAPAGGGLKPQAAIAGRNALTPGDREPAGEDAGDEPPIGVESADRVDREAEPAAFAGDEHELAPDLER